MIHQISLAECLEQISPPAKVLNVSACDDTVFVRICCGPQVSVDACPVREAMYEITYVLTGGQLGIEPGYVVLGLKTEQGSA